MEIFPMESIVGWSVMFNLCAILATSSIIAQVRIVVHACTKDGNQYICDKSNFEKILHVTKTVSVRTPRLQPSTEQLNKLARSLGKTIQSGSADLTFVLAQPYADRIYYGPSDRELAAIRVYYGANGNDPGALVWVENYYGQPGTAWPIAVNHLTEQFREEFGR